MPTIQELKDQRAALDKQIEQQLAAERSTTFDRIKAIMAESGMTVSDLVKGLSGTKVKAQGPTAGKKVAVKYRDPDTGANWTGRGLRPKWLREKVDAGAKLESFLVP